MMTVLQLDDLYRETGLTSNMEDYMEAIAMLSEEHRVVRVKDIAKKLSIKMPSVTAALNKLRDLGLIDYEKYGFIELTGKGKTIAESIYSRHRCLTEYYHVVLNLDLKTAEREACKVEHDLSPETCKQIHKLLHFYKTEEKRKSDWVNRLKKSLQ